MNTPSKEKILATFKECQALLEGHFLLSSGLHSERYLQCALVLQHPRHAQRLASLLADKFRKRKVDLVVGLAMGGITLAYEVARSLGIRAIFAEREKGKMTLRRGFSLKANERVLVVEDVITTGGSVKEVIELMESAKGKVIGVGALIDRSGDGVNFKAPFEALLKLDIKTYSSKTCPLCPQGIPLSEPGSRTLSS